ncbi:hypothetical protein [Niabella drilacis]|uniref:Uncharacterized protein n=1 Tax=Niabella drilacis (strain DSM 25811 / CCM 8410 / CCUG 62505 / LMG 26954 / E90) TaxID=1285928 RepID=A0A1G6QAL9_NIADE|nr:hypothetical protein [Niabella drilacis]SDC88717.1 hypothetical protein SAMN04487894_104319 [Niabella drilacis]
MAQHIKKTVSLVAAVFILGTAWGQETRAFNQNASRSNHTRVTYTTGQLPQATTVQNNNTVRSNRGEPAAVVIMADLDGDGVYETDCSSELAGLVTAFEGYAAIVLDRKPVVVKITRLKTRHETAKNSIGNVR